jgi:hypothetical protein
VSRYLRMKSAQGEGKANALLNSRVLLGWYRWSGVSSGVTIKGGSKVITSLLSLVACDMFDCVEGQ